MSISDDIKEYWSHWVEISEEEYLLHKQDKENYTYMVEQDTNKVKFLKRFAHTMTFQEYKDEVTATPESAKAFLKRIGAFDI